MSDSFLIELGRALKCRDIDEVRNLVEQGADSSDLFCSWYSVTRNYEADLEENDVEIIKLFLKHNFFDGVNAKNIMDGCWIQYILKPSNKRYAYELIAHILNFNKDIELFQYIFLEIIKISRNYEGPSSPDILRLLLDYGMPINDFIADDIFESFDESFTALHYSIMRQRIDDVRKVVCFIIFEKKKKKTTAVHCDLSCQRLK